MSLQLRLTYLLVLFTLLACAPAPSPFVFQPAAEPAPLRSDKSAHPRANKTWAPYSRTPMPPPLPTTSVVQPKTSETTLPNGLRVVVVEHHRRPVVITRLVFPHGSASDPEGGGGATYFAVSLLGGIYEENENGQSILEEKSLGRQIIELGGSYGGDITTDQSYISIDGYAVDTSVYLEKLASAVMRPRRGAESFGYHRTDLVHRVEDIELNDDVAFYDFLSQAAFGAGHVYARQVFGTAASLKSIGHVQIVEQQTALLSPRGAVLLVVGDVSAGPIKAAARKAFRDWRAPKKTLSTRVAPPRVRAAKHVQLIPKSPSAAMAICGARPLSDIRGQDATLDILVKVLGHGITGRLGAALRAKHGLSYTADAFIARRRHARALMACSRVASNDTDRALGLFAEAMQQMQDAPPTDDEVARAKALLIGEAEAAHDSVSSSVATWSKALELGQTAPPSDRVAAIGAVTTQDVAAMANKVLAKKSLQLLLAGEPAVAKTAVRKSGFGKALVLDLK